MNSNSSPYLSWDILRPCLACCQRIWIPELAILGQCIAIIAWIPTAISLATLVLRYPLQPLWRRRPIWLRSFAADDDLNLSDHASLEAVGPPQQKPWTLPTVVLLTNSTIGLAVSILAALSPEAGPLFLTPLITHITSVVILAVERPRSTPASPLLLQGLLLLTQLVMFSTILHVTTAQGLVLWIVEAAIPLLSLAVIVNMPMRDPFLDGQDICQPFQTPASTLRSPEDNFTLWNWMSVSWMSPIVKRACQRQLDDADVWSLPLEFQHDRLHRLFRDVKGSVLLRLLKTNAPDLMLSTCLGILESLCTLLPIVLLKQLLASLEEERPDRKVAMVYGVFILLVRLISAQSGIFNLWFCRRAYERSRGEMITMIYEKTLMRKAFTFPSEQRDSTEKEIEGLKHGAASTGKVLNLLKNDVYEISQRFWEWANLFTKPMTFALTIVLIWKILGPAALGGVLLIVFAQILNAFTIRTLVSWERARRAITDSKLQITSQFVDAIRHLRWYDWQDKWLGQILASRNKELRYRVIVNLIAKLVAATNKISAYFFPVAAFYAYTIIGDQPLHIDVAFPALTLFAQLNQSLNELPGLITVLLNASVAMQRIEDFMAEPNKEEVHGTGLYGPSAGCTTGGTEPHGKLEITVRDASFSWPGSLANTRVLSNVSFEAVPGLTAVCGKVGSGKTALLHAILGELDEQGGEIKVPSETIGYCAQTPWLQSMSIRENILFSSGLDEARYRQVLAACCLVPDLANWRAGDLALIGENGVGLSGGQKARVALARAVYSQSRILLLDDPIAALDHQTAETILRNLFTNTDLMHGRIVVFVTHRMDILTRYADQVLEITQSGTLTVISRNEIDAHKELLHFAAAKNEQRRESLDEGQRNTDDGIVPDRFIEDEFRAHGGVVRSVYWRYIKAGNLYYWAILVLLFSLFRAARLAHFYFLKVWGESYQNATTQVYLAANNAVEYHYSATSLPWLDSRTAASQSGWKDDLSLPPPDVDARPWLFWFFIIALLQFISFILSDLMIVLLIYTAGKHLFQQVMHKVTNATFRFYDVTPVGRLMNRLTSDIGTIDGQIVTQIRDVAWYFMFWASSLFVIASTTPVFLVIATIMTAVFILIFLRFLPASQSLRRLEMVSLSPLMSNFGTLLEGLTTVRAFRAQPHFQGRIIVNTDAFQKMDHFFWSLQAWLMFRFDSLSAISTFILTLSALLTGLSAGTVGFVLATAANFVACTHNLCRKYGDLQMQFVSVERVMELVDLEEEPQGELEPPAAWPTYDDDIVFDNVTVRYAKGLEPSLRNLSFRIPAGAMVAVTGRTGSGKSTLALTLLGTILPELDEGTGTMGSIHIGSIDLAKVDKHALRRRISFVAQDPVLFPGTLRDNIDPLGEYSDEECELVLRRVLGAGDEADDSFASGSVSPIPVSSGSSCGTTSDTSSTSSSTGVETDQEDGDGQPQEDNNTREHVAPRIKSNNSNTIASSLTLSTRVDGGGKNLSQGQRQLIGLGRAVLRRSPLVILDEATASIDKKTAFYIQQVLREELRQSTVITIAHRVEAVKDANFEIVLDRGKVVRAQALVRG